MSIVQLEKEYVSCCAKFKSVRDKSKEDEGLRIEARKLAQRGLGLAISLKKQYGDIREEKKDYDEKVKYYEKEQNINKALVSDSSDEIGRLLVEKLSAEPNEKVVLMMLDNSGNVTDIRVVYEGSVNSANVNLRRITEAVLVSKASSVILAHNHPGGIALPSVEDIEVTQTLKKALSLIDVDLVEHYIIAPDGYAKIINS